MCQVYVGLGGYQAQALNSCISLITQMTPPYTHTHTVLLNHSWGKLSQDKVCEAKYNMHQFDLVREIREGFPEEVIRAKG